jgi:hypothetical protein
VELGERERATIEFLQLIARKCTFRCSRSPARLRPASPIQVLERLLTQLEKRMKPSSVKLDGFQMVINELEVEMDHLRRAKRYLEECREIGLDWPVPGSKPTLCLPASSVYERTGSPKQ